MGLDDLTGLNVRSSSDGIGQPAKSEVGNPVTPGLQENKLPDNGKLRLCSWVRW